MDNRSLLQKLATPDLSRTAAALERYDAERGRIKRLWDNVETDQDVAFVTAEEERFARAVGEAFGLDTADRNNPRTCADLVRPGPKVPVPGAELSFVRRMVEIWREGR